MQISQIRVNKQRMPNDAVIVLSNNLLTQTQVNISRRGFFLQKSVNSLVKSRLALASSVFFHFLVCQHAEMVADSYTFILISPSMHDRTRPGSFVDKISKR